MKKGTRNNIILWSTISFVILFFAWIIKPDRDEQNRITGLKSNTILPAETTTTIKPIESTTETPRQKLTTKAISNLSDKNIIYCARYAITQFLKSPGSASFPVWPDNSYGIKAIENNTYLASGKVTSQNAFGVKLQNFWIIKLEFTGINLETVRATYVKIGDDVLLDVQ